jgi:hypothetical protein
MNINYISYITHVCFFIFTSGKLQRQFIINRTLIKAASTLNIVHACRAVCSHSREDESVRYSGMNRT